jgi:hypothetical protein
LDIQASLVAPYYYSIRPSMDVEDLYICTLKDMSFVQIPCRPFVAVGGNPRFRRPSHPSSILLPLRRHGGAADKSLATPPPAGHLRFPCATGRKRWHASGPGHGTASRAMAALGLVLINVVMGSGARLGRRPLAGFFRWRGLPPFISASGGGEGAVVVGI